MLEYSEPYYVLNPEKNVQMQHLWKVMDDIQKAIADGAQDLNLAISLVNGCNCIYESVTYSDLVSLISNSDLKPTHFYLITDFQTTFKLTNIDDGAGAIEPLLVLATSYNELSPFTLSQTYIQDKLCYNILDTTPLAPNTIANSKGVITYRESFSNNLSAFYDWRNVLFRRWERTAGAGVYFWNTDPSIYVGSGGQAFADLYTFYDADGGSNTNCSLGEGSYNIVMGDANTAISIEKNCGVLNGGINIGSFNDGININSNCATQSSASSYMPPGIYIGDSNLYIEIGQRSYSVYVEDSCYAINLGTQQSDVAIPTGTWRKVMFKGYSNFDTTIDITGLSYIDLVNNEIQLLGGVIRVGVAYCGIIYLSSSNSTETINEIIPVTTSVIFSPYRFIPNAGLSCDFEDKSVSGGSANIILPQLLINIDSSKTEYIVLDRYMLTTSNVSSDFHLEYTNSMSFLSGYVKSVTDDGLGGVSVDNTDPQNPIISLSVVTDGVTITGTGVTADPLVASGAGIAADLLSPLLLMGG